MGGEVIRVSTRVRSEDIRSEGGATFFMLKG